MLQWPSDPVWQARQDSSCLCQSRSITPSSGQTTSSTCKKVTRCTQARPDVVSMDRGQSNKWTPLTVILHLDTVGVVSMSTPMKLCLQHYLLQMIKWMADAISSTLQIFFPPQFSCDLDSAKSIKTLCRIDWYCSGQISPQMPHIWVSIL